MNPYDFVPYPGSIDRRGPSGHDRFEGRSGTLSCELEALTPFLVLDGDERPQMGSRMAGRPLRDQKGRYVIPGTSLKGLVRSAFEVLMPSCVATHGGNTNSLVSGDVRKCESTRKLCPACRVFGYLKHGNSDVHKGLVHIGQAQATDAQEGRRVQLVPLSNPEPHHSAFYKPGGTPAGRKFYFHQHAISEPQNENEKERGPWVEPLAEGSTFRFEVTFENLTGREVAGLVAALTLADAAPHDGGTVAVRHKLGYGKPAGLGSVAIRLRRATLRGGAEDRYRSFAPQATTYDGEALAAWVDEQRAPFFETPSEPVRELIRILRFPPAEGVTYQYPSYQWFQDNPRAPLDQTP